MAASAALTPPRGIAASRKPTTQRLPKVLREVGTLLDRQIDPLLVPLTKTNPQWYERYRATRIGKVMTRDGRKIG